MLQGEVAGRAGRRAGEGRGGQRGCGGRLGRRAIPARLPPTTPLDPRHATARRQRHGTARRQRLRGPLSGFGRREPSPGGAGRGAPLARPVAGNECGAGRGVRSLASIARASLAGLRALSLSRMAIGWRRHTVAQAPGDLQPGQSAPRPPAARQVRAHELAAWRRLTRLLLRAGAGDGEEGAEEGGEGGAASAVAEWWGSVCDWWPHWPFEDERTPDEAAPPAASSLVPFGVPGPQ